jgi:hypothetical protein
LPGNVQGLGDPLALVAFRQKPGEKGPGGPVVKRRCLKRQRL